MKIITNIFLFKNPNNIQKYRALWDTGATETLISKTAINNLDLSECGEVTINTLHGSKLVKRYEVKMILENHLKSINLMPAYFDHRDECDFIIGMDIISKGLFILDHGKLSFNIENLK